MLSSGVSNGGVGDFSLLNVSLSARYTGAWSEINARLMSRQNVNMQFTTVTLTATSLCLTLYKENIYEWLINAMAISLIVFVWAFALWIRHNDSIIGLLSSFCKALELAEDPNNTRGIPAWHTDVQEWITMARNFRIYSDYASNLVAFVACIPIAMQAFTKLQQKAWFASLIFGAFLLVGFCAVIFIYNNAKLRKNISLSSFQKVNNTQGATNLYKFVRPGKRNKK